MDRKCKKHGHHWKVVITKSAGRVTHVDMACQWCHTSQTAYEDPAAVRPPRPKNRKAPSFPRSSPSMTKEFEEMNRLMKLMDRWGR